MARVGLAVAGRPATPFVLVDTAPVLGPRAVPDLVRGGCAGEASLSGAATPSPGCLAIELGLVDELRMFRNPIVVVAARPSCRRSPKTFGSTWSRPGRSARA
ncbi:MAG TPA: hypothetical protein VIU11_23845 [Nakamurella sp.]